MAESSDQRILKLFNNQYIIALQNELEIIKSLNCPILSRLEIDRLRGGIADYVDLISNKKVKVRAKVDIPVEQYPSINFVGKLLGPGASTLKSIQEQTSTKMTIRGIDNQKKVAIVPGQCEKLHLQIDSLGTPAEAYYKLSHAVTEVQKSLKYNSVSIFHNGRTRVRHNPYQMCDMARDGRLVRMSVRGSEKFVPPPAVMNEQNYRWTTKEFNGEEDEHFETIIKLGY